jgi:hypothetical protein
VEEAHRVAARERVAVGQEGAALDPDRARVVRQAIGDRRAPEGEPAQEDSLVRLQVPHQQSAVDLDIRTAGSGLAEDGNGLPVDREAWIAPLAHQDHVAVLGGVHGGLDGARESAAGRVIDHQKPHVERGNLGADTRWNLECRPGHHLCSRDSTCKEQAPRSELQGLAGQ